MIRASATVAEVALVRHHRGYRSIGYARGEAPLGYAEPKELTIEYDADVGIDAEA